MRRMLDPTKVGGIPSTIEFDKDGNRKVAKNLGVDGKLTLKSLISSTNQDGDITKELGGAKLYKHTINAFSSTYGSVYITLYNYSDAAIDTDDKLKTAIAAIGEVSATGYFRYSQRIYNVCLVQLLNTNEVAAFGYRVLSDNTAETSSRLLDYSFVSYKDNIKQVN